jgi:hypothetical protein
MPTPTTVIKWSALSEMLADPVIRAVMYRDGVSDREVARAVEMARSRTDGERLNDREAGRTKIDPVSPIPSQAQSVSKPDIRRLPWNP